MITLAALSLVLAACGDSTAPDAPFNPTGMSADVDAVDDAFESPVVQSFSAVTDELGAVSGGGSAAVAALSIRPLGALTTRAGAAEFSKTLAARLSARNGAGPSFATMPAEYAGKTFVYNPDTDQYEVSSHTGVPSNSVRFILYSVNPITTEITEPLNEIGYAQLTLGGGSTSHTARLTVVSDGETYLDYTVVASASSSTATVSIDGFVTNGTDRLNFDLSMHLTGDEDSGTLTFDYVLEVPTRGFRFEMEIGLSSESEAITLSLEARGENGRVNIEGTIDGAQESFTVHVNGDLFATITSDGTTTTIVRADGEPLTEDERHTLEQVFAVYDEEDELLDVFVVPF